MKFWSYHAKQETKSREENKLALVHFLYEMNSRSSFRRLCLILEFRVDREDPRQADPTQRHGEVDKVLTKQI